MVGRGYGIIGLCMRNEALGLRDWFVVEFDFLRARLDQLHKALRNMPEKGVTVSEFDNLKYQVIDLTEAFREMEQRLDQLEKHNGIIRWVGRQVVTLAFIVVAIYAIGFLR